MTEFKSSRVIDRMAEFIRLYPSWVEYGMRKPTLTQIGTQTFNANRPTQFAIDFVGSPVTLDSPRSTGARSITRQANFQMLILQSSGDPVLRADNTDFIWDFTQWVDYASIMELTPILGDEPDFERMWVSNAMWNSEFEGQTASVYLIQMHKTYIKNYESRF